MLEEDRRSVGGLNLSRGPGDPSSRARRDCITDVSPLPIPGTLSHRYSVDECTEGVARGSPPGRSHGKEWTRLRLGVVYTIHLTLGVTLMSNDWTTGSRVQGVRGRIFHDVDRRYPVKSSEGHTAFRRSHQGCTSWVLWGHTSCDTWTGVFTENVGKTLTDNP